MCKLLAILCLSAGFLCFAEAMSKQELYQTIHSVGDEIRIERITELKNTIKETLERATSLEQKMCINTQISNGYRELNRSLGTAQNTLRKEFGAMSTAELEIAPTDQLAKQVESKLRAAVGSFGERLQAISQCA